MPVSSVTEHWIKPDAVTINLNHFGDPDYLQVSVLAGAVVMAFKQDVIAYNAAHNYRTWPLQASNTYLETISAYNVYARLTRSEVNASALIVYDPVLRDIEGSPISYADDGSEVLGEPDSTYFYIFLGQISESVDNNGNKKDREWLKIIQYGSLDSSEQKNNFGSLWEKLFKPHYEDPTDPEKLSWIEAKANMGIQGGVSMFIKGDNVYIPTIAEGLPFDGRTIWFNPTTNQIEVIGGIGGGVADSVAWQDVVGKPSWLLDDKISYSEIEGTPDLSVYALKSAIPSLDGYAKLTDIPSLNGYATEQWVIGKGYALNSDLTALSNKVTDFLEGSDTDNIINKWKELESFLNGLSESDNLATILGTKADKSYVDSTFVTINGTEDVTGLHDFTNGLKIGGMKLFKSQDDVVYLDGNLVVRGGVTMYAVDKVTIDSIIDSLPTASTSVKGIASFDSAFFTVDGNGKVSLIESNVGLNEDELSVYLENHKYATQEWVSQQKYITGISSQMVVSALGFTPYDSASFTKANIKSTLGISDWALAASKPSYKTSEVTEDGNLYFTDARAVNALSATIRALQDDIATKWTQDDTKIANWDAAYKWGDHSKVGYALKSYVDDELTKYVTIAGTEDITGLHNFVNGLKIGGINVYKSQDGVVYIDGNVAIKGGLTMYANDGNVEVGTIYDGLPIDNSTIYWDIDANGNKVLKALSVSGGGGVADAVAWQNVIGKPSWLIDDEINYSEIKNTPDLSVYALKSSIPSLSGYATEKWVTDKGYATTSDLDARIDALVNGAPTAYDTLKEIADVLQGNVNSIGDIITTLGSKADKATTLSGYGITDAKIVNGVITLGGNTITPLVSHQTIYTLTFASGAFSSGSFTANSANKTINVPTTTSHISEGDNLYFTNERAVYALADTLKDYALLGGENTFTNVNDFTGGLKVNGSTITYDKTNKCWKLEGDLLVTGGVTMYGNDSEFVPSTIMDAILYDSSTLGINSNGQLYVKGGAGGAITSIDYSMVVSALGYIPLQNHQTIYALTIKKNGASLGTYTPNDSTKTIDIAVPTKVSDLNNDSAFISGVTSQMVTTALGYTPYNSTNPNGYITSSAIPTSLKNPYSLTFGSKTYDGSAAKTITASDLGALTAHQTIYNLTIKNSAGTTQLTYDPNGEAGSITLTKAMVGLGNVENTALSSWTGTNKITTLGTITTGTWNGSKIANSYLANSSVTISGKSVSLGGSISQADLRSGLGLGSNAYSSTAYLPVSGGTIGAGNSNTFPLNISSTNDYSGIVFANKNSTAYFRYLGAARWNVTNDGWTASYDLWHSGNFTPSNYLPLTGGILTGALRINTDSANCLYLQNTQATSTSRYAAIRFVVGGTHIAGIGVSTSGGVLQRINSDFSGSYTVWDSGNDGSGSGLDADLLDGKHNGELAAIQLNVNNTTTPGVRVTFNSGFIPKGNTVDYSWCSPTGNYTEGGKTGEWMSIIRVDANNKYYHEFSCNMNESRPYWRQVISGASKGWHQFAFTDSNVASATKLQTARTIWGQSFDGTGNVSGNLFIPNGNALQFKNSSSANVNSLYFDSSNILHLGYGTSGSYNTKIYGNNLYLHYGSRSTGMVLNNSGNVTIGSTDLASTNYKLYVNGKHAVNGDIQFASNAKYVRGVLTDGTSTNLLGVNDANDLLIGYGQRLLGCSTNYYGGIHAWYYGVAGSSSIGMFLNSNGNVGIGTANPDHKLYVAGRIKTLTSDVDGLIVKRHQSTGIASVRYLPNNQEVQGWRVGASSGYNMSFEYSSDSFSSTTTNMTLSNAGLLTLNGVMRVQRRGNTSSYLDITSDDIFVKYNGYDSDGYCGHIFYSNGVELFRIAGNTKVATFQGNVLTSGGLTMYSARKLKTIQDERGLSLEELRTIKPTRFTWKDGRDNRLHIGGIADDVMKVLPEVIYKTDDDTLTMDYGNAAFAIAASLIKPVVSLEQRIKVLEEENKRLKEEVEQLKWNIA